MRHFDIGILMTRELVTPHIHSLTIRYGVLRRGSLRSPPRFSYVHRCPKKLFRDFALENFLRKTVKNQTARRAGGGQLGNLGSPLPRLLECWNDVIGRTVTKGSNLVTTFSDLIHFLASGRTYFQHSNKIVLHKLHVARFANSFFRHSISAFLR